MSRRLVSDLAATHTAWRIPAASVAAIRTALGAGWEVVEVRTPAVSAGDGGVGEGGGRAEAAAAARGAEIYLGFGVPDGVLAAGRGTLRWAHSGTAGVGSSLPSLRGTGVVLTNSAGVHAEPMADWVIAAIGYFARGGSIAPSRRRRGAAGSRRRSSSSRSRCASSRTCVSGSSAWAGSAPR